MKWRFGFLWTNKEDAQEICDAIQHMGAKFIEQGYADLLDDNNRITGFCVILTFMSTKKVFDTIYETLTFIKTTDKKWVKEDIFGLPGIMAREV